MTPVLSRLAVDINWQGQGVDQAHLRDAILRTIQVSEIVGLKVLVVNELLEQKVHFYKSAVLNNRRWISLHY